MLGNEVLVITDHADENEYSVQLTERLTKAIAKRLEECCHNNVEHRDNP